MLPNSLLHQLAKYIVKFSFGSISSSSKCLNAWYALSLPFMRKREMRVLPPVAPHSHASQEHLIRDESKVNEKQICLGGKTDMFGWASTTNKLLHGFPARS
jgi:hypothetical protein